jgi:transketolase
LHFWRPADGNETSAAYAIALKSAKTPSVIALSRQNLPNLVNSTIENASRGGYVLREVQKEAITFVSTGSEVSIVLEAAGILEREGIIARVVSLPCWEVFDAQDKAYRTEVLRSGAPILSVEPYSTVGWERYSHEVRCSPVVISPFPILRSNLGSPVGVLLALTRRCTRNLGLLDQVG